MLILWSGGEINLIGVSWKRRGSNDCKYRQLIRSVFAVKGYSETGSYWRDQGMKGRSLKSHAWGSEGMCQREGKGEIITEMWSLSRGEDLVSRARSKHQENISGDFIDCPVLRLRASNAGGPGLISLSSHMTQLSSHAAHMPQLKIPHATTKDPTRSKILCATTKTQSSQINKYFLRRECFWIPS